ncbi:mitochondrial import inner membrane translocase subunit TIM44-2-like isoform X1 [Amaranthus tricolor]|uniref:mitochondrial import inner membrane translocase subunit TIM44-2-like isoform X1 n=1 Tax=Amaranthus tricolor TaxID=29722 RepID=UPI00258F65A9|nr:mitochondrial import inner membrane translocase subunit TIM44-2-like isoform X1 [Amaranthus tricolor]
MATRKLIRDFFIFKQHISFQWLPSNRQLHQSNSKFRLISGIRHSSNRQFSVFNEFSKKIKGETSSNKEFQQSVNQLKEKAHELRGVKEDLKVRVKQTTQQLHKHVDGVWTEAEETAKKVSAFAKEKISAASEEVKGSLGFGGQEPSASNGTTLNNDGNVKDGTASSDQQHQQSEPIGSAETLFDKVKSTFASPSLKVSSAFQRLKEIKMADWAKKSYDIVKEELSGKPNRRKQMHYASSTGETSDRTEVVVVPVKQSPWSKKWEEVKEKMRSHPMFKSATKISEPVVTKSQELAEDLQERWETSDSPVVHKIQDLNDRVFGENDAAMSFKEIRRRDPSFSLPDFVAEVQEVIKPVLTAYLKGDFKVLEKYCSPEVVERCKALHKASESQDIFFDNKILHVSEVDVRETKMMGSSPIIILAFQTQQVYCARDRQGSIKEGSQDTIQTVYYAWAMQQVEPDEIDVDAIYSMWKLREMQQFGITALI